MRMSSAVYFIMNIRQRFVCYTPIIPIMYWIAEKKNTFTKQSKSEITLKQQ